MYRKKEDKITYNKQYNKEHYKSVLVRFNNNDTFDSALLERLRNDETHINRLLKRYAMLGQILMKINIKFAESIIDLYKIIDSEVSLFPFNVGDIFRPFVNCYYRDILDEIDVNLLAKSFGNDVYENCFKPPERFDVNYVYSKLSTINDYEKVCMIIAHMFYRNTITLKEEDMLIDSLEIKTSSEKLNNFFRENFSFEE